MNWQELGAVPPQEGGAPTQMRVGGGGGAAAKGGAPHASIRTLFCCSRSSFAFCSAAIFSRSAAKSFAKSALRVACTPRPPSVSQQRQPAASARSCAPVSRCHASFPVRKLFPSLQWRRAGWHGSAGRSTLAQAAAGTCFCCAHTFRRRGRSRGRSSKGNAKATQATDTQSARGATAPTAPHQLIQMEVLASRAGAPAVNARLAVVHQAVVAHVCARACRGAGGARRGWPRPLLTQC